MHAASDHSGSGYATSWRTAVRPPAGVAATLREAARSGLISTLGRINRGMADRFVRCLYCHYVFDDQVADFERLVRRLKAIGSFVDTATLLDMLAGARPVEGRHFHLSFDDGFRNNVTNALPVLQRHAVPAIFFVPTALIDADWHRARDYCLDVTHHRAVIEMMRWDDLKAVLDAGYEVGSHTRTHMRFTSASGAEDRLTDEIAGSKHDLETRLRYRCRFISWPYGRTTDADAASIEFTRAAGYEACFGAFRGTVRPGTTDRYRIPRHHFEPQWPPAHVEYFARGNREGAE